jgi:hypothetical protein
VEQDVSKEKSFKYWFHKPRRVLLAIPEKTEKIFQRALFCWLDRYVSNKVRVIAETRGFGQDPADVLVITVRGDHLVEIKWLGTNQNGHHYGQERINEGLRQVADYIERDDRIAQAHLVVYDARDGDSHRTQSGFDPACRHAQCSDPKVIFLESEAPSQRAKRTKLSD